MPATPPTQVAAEGPWPILKWRGVCCVARLCASEGRLERAVAPSVPVLDPIWAGTLEYGVGLRLMIELGSRLPPSVFAAAEDRGRSMSLRATVEELLAELAS